MAKKIGEILLSRNQITGEQLQEGLSTQVVYGARLGTALVQLGHISLDDVGRGLSTQHGVPHAESDMLDNTEQTALDAVSRELCEKLKVVPMRLEGEILHVAMMDPLRSVAGEISFELGFPIQRYVAPELRVLYYLEQFYDIQRDPRYLRLPEAGEEAEAAPAEPPPQQESKLDQRRLAPDASAKDRRKYISVTLDPPTPEEPPRAGHRMDSLGLVALDDYVLADDDYEAQTAAREPHPVAAFRKVDVLSEKLDAADTGGSVAQHLVEPCVENLAVSILFWVRDNYAVACAAKGTQTSAQKLNKLVISLNRPSLLQMSMQQRAIVRAKGRADSLQPKMAEFLGSPVPDEVSVAPIILRGKVINLLCLHSREDAPFEDDSQEELRLLVERAAAAYQRLTK